MSPTEPLDNRIGFDGMGPPVTHIVYVDRKKGFRSETLPHAALGGLGSAFEKAPWWGDRWRHRVFRAAARAVLREHGSLVLLGPRLTFEVPPPFHEMFEPIEIATGHGGNRDELKTISGDAPTRQERQAWIAWVIVAILMISLTIPFVLFFVRGMPREIKIGMTLTIPVVAVIVAAALALRRLSGRWFLVPGGIAVVRRPTRRGHNARVTVLSRADSCLVLRYVQAGKTTVLMVEIWPPAGKQIRRPVSDREALSILAAWQSAHAPPEDRQLNELVSW